MKEHALSLIDKDEQFKQIEITGVKAQTSLLISNVQLLSYVVIEMIDLQTSLIVRCTKCVLNTFHNAHVRVKSRCLRYFNKLLNHTNELDEALQPMLVSILENIEYFEKVIPLWIHHKLVKVDDVNTFANLANDFLNNPNIYKLFNRDQLRRAAHCCLNILRTHGHLKVGAYDNIEASVYKVVRTIATEVNDVTLHLQIFRFVEPTVSENQLFASNITLMTPGILDQMKNSQTYSWALVDQKINDIQREEDESDIIIIDQLRCVYSILNSARYLEYSLAVHMQRQRCDDDKDNTNSHGPSPLWQENIKHTLNKSLRPLFGQLSVLYEYVLSRFNALLSTKFSPLVDTSTLLLFVDIAIAIVSLSNVQDIDTYTQLQFLLIALCPFLRNSELLFNHLQQAFEVETSRIVKIMETPCMPNRMGVPWQMQAFQSIINMNLECVSTENKGIFLDIFVQIATNVHHPGYLEQIINVLTNCVIQIDTYGAGDLEKFIETVARDERNQLVVSNHLRLFYCLSSGRTLIMQTSKGDEYRYKIMCPMCMLNTDVMHENVESVKRLLNTTGGRFVRAHTTKHTEHTAHHIAYFKMFKSPDQKIRENMTFCLPAILNHLNLSLYENVADIWLNPLVDHEMNIRLWMIKHIHIIPKRGNERIRKICFDKLLECTKIFLIREHKSDQSIVLSLISSFATASEITEPLLLGCFRLTLYFCMCTKSMVSRQAALCASEMCFKFGITPENILTWNKTEMYSFIISLCVSNYMKDNVGLQKSLHPVSTLLDFG